VRTSTSAAAAAVHASPTSQPLGHQNRSKGVQKGVILGHVDRFETGQKVLTDAPAGTAAPTSPATALASPGASRTELIRVFYVVLYPYSRNRPEFSPTATMY
jgi:hypothetical protein